MKPKQELLIHHILSEMDWDTEREEVLANVQEKWQTPTRTFDRYWKIAKDRFDGKQTEVSLARNLVRSQSIAEAKHLAILEVETSRARAKIMDKFERMEILSQIARAEINLVKEVLSIQGVEMLNVKPDYNDRKAAIAELNKMDGDYAPIKKDLTSGGEKIQNTPSNIQIEIIKNKDED
jgi:hypothetical protein